MQTIRCTVLSLTKTMPQVHPATLSTGMSHLPAAAAGATAWYSLPEARRKAIGLILLYSDEMWDHSISVTTTYKDDNPNVPLRIATQFLIYEIVCGLRDPETFVLNSANESGTAGNIFYNAGAASVSYFAPNYNTLVSCVQAALKIPSFTSSSSSSAPTITLTGDVSMTPMEFCPGSASRTAMAQSSVNPATHFISPRLAPSPSLLSSKRRRRFLLLKTRPILFGTCPAPLTRQRSTCTVLSPVR